MLIGPLGAIVVTENWALAGNCNTRGELRIFLLVKKIGTTVYVRTRWIVTERACRPARGQPPLVEWAPKCGTVHEIAGQTLCENPYPPARKRTSALAETSLIYFFLFICALAN